MPESQGVTVSDYNNFGQLRVGVSDIFDEVGRPILRAESRDDHDSTYFTTRGDSWSSVSAEAVGTGDGSTVQFQLDQKETRSLTVKQDGVMIPASAYSIDATTYVDGNSASHFSYGLLTFAAAPASGVAITADYEYATIGTGDTTVFEASAEDQTYVTWMNFCDPVHIKDGVAIFENGAIDTVLNVYVVCPAGYYYYDNNVTPQYAVTDTIIHHYVVDQILLGTAHVGIYFDVEARSKALPIYYRLKVEINSGSSSTFKGFARMEINRQRTII